MNAGDPMRPRAGRRRWLPRFRREARVRALPALVVLLPLLVLLPALAFTSTDDVGRDVPPPITFEPRVPAEPTATATASPTAVDTAEPVPTPPRLKHPWYTEKPEPLATPAPLAPPASTPEPTPSPPRPSPSPVPTPAIPPSGESVPRGDIPGWEQIFVDDFTNDVPLGGFAVSSDGRWKSYPPGARDTSRHGAYSTGRVVSVQDGVLRKHLHYADGDYRVAALMPLLEGESTSQLYGRYAIRFRAEPVEGYKISWLLWPRSERWPFDGEIDWPEGELTGTKCAYMHRQEGTWSADQDYFCTGTPTAGPWYTAVIEWEPNRVGFYLDGRLIGESTDRIPNTAMRWVIQTETRISGTPPPQDAAGYVYIDWVAVWKYAP